MYDYIYVRVFERKLRSRRVVKIREIIYGINAPGKRVACVEALMVAKPKRH